MTQANSKAVTSKKGSILIWTVLLGTLLTTAFLFFILRFGDGKALQQAVMEQNIERQYLESMMGYFKALSFDQLNTHKSDELHLFEGEITGQLTNEFNVIEGILDAGESHLFPEISDEIAVFWNRCDLGENSELLIDQDLATSATQCGPVGVRYDQIQVLEVSHELPLELVAPSTPVHYAIKSTTPENLLPGNKWFAELEISLPYRRSVSLSEWFKPFDL